MTDVVRKRDIWTLAIKGVAKDQPPRQRRDGWFFDNTFFIFDTISVWSIFSYIAPGDIVQQSNK
jgi:hypothetical protein